MGGVENVPEPVRDAVYTVLGLAVLSFQRAMVLRRDLARDLPDLGFPSKQVSEVLRTVAEAVRPK